APGEAFTPLAMTRPSLRAFSTSARSNCGCSRVSTCSPPTASPPKPSALPARHGRLRHGVEIAAFYDWGTVVQYVSHDVNFTEAAFVVVIMTLAATRPTLKLVESIMLAVAGGGLTIIANAPNPAGQFLLKHHFGEAVSPLGLLAAALVPAIVVWMCFLLL
ncbi:MAG TPA: hypothetical protein EYP56_04760, partial [Planctomycetaceae bacterium]|nr:hypothetical protein [Planctomycetaceae bacterium]